MEVAGGWGERGEGEADSEIRTVIDRAVDLPRVTVFGETEMGTDGNEAREG